MSVLCVVVVVVVFFVLWFLSRRVQDFREFFVFVQRFGADVFSRNEQEDECKFSLVDVDFEAIVLLNFTSEILSL